MTDETAVPVSVLSEAGCRFRKEATALLSERGREGGGHWAAGMTWRSLSGCLVILRTDTGRAAPSTVHIIVQYRTLQY